VLDTSGSRVVHRGILDRSANANDNGIKLFCPAMAVLPHTSGQETSDAPRQQIFATFTPISGRFTFLLSQQRGYGHPVRTGPESIYPRQVNLGKIAVAAATSNTTAASPACLGLSRVIISASRFPCLWCSSLSFGSDCRLARIYKSRRERLAANDERKWHIGNRRQP